VVGQLKIPPSEYWGMTPAEVFAVLDANRPRHINGIHEDDYDMIEERREELEAKGVKVV
jgi:hypothetical protein